MPNEQDRVREVMQATARGNATGRKLIWDPHRKRIRAVDYNDRDSGGLELTPEDMSHFAAKE